MPATKTPTATQAFRSVLQSAERIQSDALEIIATLSPGDVVRQGDLYLICLDTTPSVIGNAPTNQLAPGSTQGSRHVAEPPAHVFLVQETAAHVLLKRLVPAMARHVPVFIGPMVQSANPFPVTHPEHGDKVLPPGSYLVVYQRAYAETIRRQMD